MRFSIFLVFIMLMMGCAPEQQQKIPIKVVLVSMFESGEDSADRPGEFQYWVENLPLHETIEFPLGYRDLRYNPDKGVLGVVTGVGNTKAAVSIMALGSDPRFDFSDAYWVVAGISGVDPADAPTGSAVWAEYIIDGDLCHEIDAREIPEDWTTGYIPLRHSKPYAKPFPPNKEVVVHQLDPGLVEWAYQLTKDIALPDNEEIKGMREQYVGYAAATMSPVVMKGDQLAASTYWHGELLNQWANDWVDYWTEGQGNFVTSAMEEIGTYHALERLESAGLVNSQRFLVLRTASNFTMQWPGITAQQSLAGEKLSGKGYSAYIPSLEAAYQVGSVVVNALVDDWDQHQHAMPR